MNCPNCGKLIPEEAQICPFCLFVIKDWKEGKVMTNDQGQVLPKYVPENEKQDVIDEESVNDEQINSRSFQHRGSGVKNEHGRTPYSAHQSHNSETNTPVTNEEPEPSISKTIEEKPTVEEKKTAAPKVEVVQSDPKPKSSYSTPQTDTFRHSRRADQIQTEAIKKKYNSSKPSVNSSTENIDSIRDFNQPDSSEYTNTINSKSSQGQFDDTPVDDITNVSFEEPQKESNKRKKAAKIVVLIFLALIIILGIFLAFNFLVRTTVGGKSIDVKDFSNLKTTIVSKENQKTSKSDPKRITIKISGYNHSSIPLKNLVILANGQAVKFQTDESTADFNDGQAELNGKVSGLKLFSNNLSLRITSDQNKKLYQSKESQVTFPFDLAGTYWEAKLKSDVNSPVKTVKFNFISDQAYEETVGVAKVPYGDTKKVKRWTSTALTGAIVQGKSNDGSIRYLTNPQQFVETEYISNFHQGKEPITRIKYKGGQIPDDLSDYRHELRLKNNKLYYFLTSDDQQGKTQIFLLDEIEPHDFTAFAKSDALPEVKQEGLTAQPKVRKEVRQRILQNFTDQLSYQMPSKNMAHLNTIFYDSPNGEQTTGLITYLSGGKDNNLMKFILYRNGRLNVYPLNSGFEVPKAYTINIYKDLKNNNFESFPDFKK